MRLTEEEYNDIVNEASAPASAEEQPFTSPFQEERGSSEYHLEQEGEEQPETTAHFPQEASQHFSEERISQTPPPKKKEKKYRSPLYWLSGGLIVRFINSKWAPLVVWIFFLFFCNVALGYVTISQTKQISKLESELETVRNKQLFIKADISRLTREETMRTRLEELNSTVTEKEDQPFVIYYGRDNKN